MSTWRKSWTETSGRKFLEEGESESELRVLRRSTYTGRPLGSEDFVAGLEASTRRRLRAQKGGRPRRTSADRIRMRSS